MIPIIVSYTDETETKISAIYVFNGYGNLIRAFVLPELEGKETKQHGRRANIAEDLFDTLIQMILSWGLREIPVYLVKTFGLTEK